MNTIQRVAKNTGVLFFSQVASYILSFFFMMYTARYLGAEGFGILSFALAFAGIFGVFADLGLSLLTVREVARDKSLARKYLGNFTIMKIILAAITFALIAFFANFLGYPRQTINVVYIVALSTIFTSFLQMFYSVFQAFERMEYQSFGQILSSGLMLSAVFFAISQGFSVVGFAWIYLIVNTITLTYAFIVCVSKFVLLKMEVDWSFWKSAIKEAWPFGLTGILVTVYYWIDSVMLSLMHGNVVVGWYNAAYRLFYVLLFIPNIINAAIFPSMSRFYISSKNSLIFGTKHYFKLMLIIGLPMGIVTTLLADKIILLIFGRGYIQSIIAIRILIWAMVFIFINAPFAQLFGAVDKQVLTTIIAFIGMVENIVLNLLLIPKFSFVGASATTVVTEFTILVLVIIFAYKIGYMIPRKEFLTNISKVGFAALIMGMFLWYFNTLDLVTLILVGIFLYSLLLYFIRGISEEDIKILKQVIGKRL